MEEFGEQVEPYLVIPFALMLLGIAVLPLVAEHWWENNRNRAIFAGLVSTPIGVYLVINFPEGLAHSLEEYFSFLALLGSLYIIAGGIHIAGDLKATPTTNTIIMGIGAVLASVVGTTGASMLLIRMILRTNGQRKEVGHIPFFFILIVSNCGGLLTPMGDPPLFLGYLRGVPFVWTLGLWPYWGLAIFYLLSLFYLLDARAYAKEGPSAVQTDSRARVPIQVRGLINAPLLLAVIGAIFIPTPYREIVMIALSVASVVLGPRPARQANAFTYGPILEVAILFAGIFITMVPALALLEARGGELGLDQPWQFFLVTGGLSSVLDNAPTYLTFLAAALGLGLEQQAAAHPGIELVHLNDGALPEVFLVAISVGAVFMGANTYIGNGPNFMVKAIAEENKYKMPSFFAFAARSVVTLVPIYIVMSIIFVLSW